MTFATAEARQQLLDEIASATNEIGVALGALGDAYELLDERAADRLEEVLFRPVQVAYGRAKRTHADFAARHGLRGRTFAPASSGAPSHGVKGFLETAVTAVGHADAELGELQDSMRGALSQPSMLTGALRSTRSPSWLVNRAAMT